MTPGPDFLAVDAGQSSIRIRHRSTDLTLPGLVSGESPVAQCARAIGSAMQGRVPPTVAVGLSGRGDEAAAELLSALIGFGVRRVILAHDSVTSYLGALGERHGAVIAAGTGTVCLAVGETRTARVDGWGHLLGDAGSAFWIGREAMAAALRGFDGRGPATKLTQALRDEWGDLEHLYLALQSDPAHVARVAAFAQLVDELADSDAVAQAVVEAAAAELAETTLAGLRRVGLMGRAPHVAALGGVFGSDRVRDGFVRALRRVWPEFRLTRSAGQGIDGAAALALGAIPQALRSLISTAAG